MNLKSAQRLELVVTAESLNKEGFALEFKEVVLL